MNTNTTELSVTVFLPIASSFGGGLIGLAGELITGVAFAFNKG